jgi:isopentenyl-diphosphate Delta-isomerase
MREELMILVNEHDEEIGALEKIKTHQEGLMHRAFSIFLFNDAGEMLIHKRAKQKYHSGGLWTNACCGHPNPNEEISAAAHRRMFEELGIKSELNKAFDFTYKAKLDNGLTEHEFDHVFIGTFNEHVPFNLDEVDSISFIELKELDRSIEKNPMNYTEWFKIAYPLLKSYLIKEKLFTA